MVLVAMGLAAAIAATPYTPEALLTVDEIHAIVDERAIGWTADEIRDIAEAVHEAADKAGIDARLVLGIMQTESHFKRGAKSSVGARGLLQVMPKTAEAYADEAGVAWAGPHTLHEPDANVRIGVAYFAWLLKRFKGDVDVALAAYCHGPYRVLKLLRSEGRLADDTLRYSKKVRRAWRGFKARSAELAMNDAAEVPGT